MPAALDGEELVLTARITAASNATFVGRLGDVDVAYKPVAGERPLWDFPEGTLAQREVAAFAVSEALEWELVPPTWLHDGPLGPGMVQLWREPDPEQEAVALVSADRVPPAGWRHILDGLDGDGRAVSLIHEDTPALRRLAVFDLLINNADRKGGHVLEAAGGHRFAIDHGVTFHTDHKLRTVLWGWIGEDLSADELAAVERVRRALDGELASLLADFITDDEIAALIARCERLLAAPVFPAPSGDMPAIPWPPF